MPHRVLAVGVRHAAGITHQRPRLVAATAHAALDGRQQQQVLGDRGVPVQVDDLLLCRRRRRLLEPPLPDQQRAVYGDRHPAKGVEHTTRVALDRRVRPHEERPVRVVGRRSLIRRSGRRPRRVTHAVAAAGDPVAVPGDHSGGEGRVHVRAVVALVVVLDRQLPVGFDYDGVGVREHSPLSVWCERAELVCHSRHVLIQGLGILVEVHEQEAAQRLDPHRRDAQLADVRAARPQQPAVAVVGPRVIRARDAVDMARRGHQQFVPPVLAHVEHRAHPTGAAQHDDALVTDGSGDVVPVVRDLAHVTDQVPGRGEHGVELALPHLRVGVRLPRQRQRSCAIHDMDLPTERPGTQRALACEMVWSRW